MILRAALATDAPRIRDLWNNVIENTHFTFNFTPYTTDNIEEMIAQRAREGAPFLVAQTPKSQFLGFATYGRFRAGSGYRHTAEHTVMLSPDAQRAGVGRALMAALEDHAKTHEIHVLVAGISGANPAAIAFHQALGFTQVGHMPQVGRKDQTWLDLILMQKLL